VLESVHLHALFSGLAARPGGALRVVPSGVEPLGSETSRFTYGHSNSMNWKVGSRGGRGTVPTKGE